MVFCEVFFPLLTGGPEERLAALLDPARAGDRAAMEGWLGAAYEYMFPLCRRLTGDDADGADAAQEALISAHRSLRRFDGRSRVTTWLYRIATNAALDQMRRRERRRRLTLVVGTPGPANLVDGVAERMDVAAALRRLPLDFRAAVVLRDLCGLDYAEMATVLGVPEGTAKSRVARGRSQLVHLLDVER